MRTELQELMMTYPNFFIVLFIIVAVTLLIISIHHIAKNLFKTFKNKKKIIKKIVKLEQPILIIVFIMGAQAIFSTYLRDYPRIHSNLNNFLISLSIILVTYMFAVIASLLLDNWSKRLKKTKHDETHEGIVPLMKSVVYLFLGLLALIFILQTWEVSVGALLTSLGIAGVIIGFAFKDTLTNVFGGIALVLDDTFKKGDLIELSDGEIGFVIETSLRSTKIKNFDNEEIFIPNSALSNMRVKNYAKPTKSIRLKVVMPVAIGCDIDKAERVVLSMLDKREDILKYPRPKFYFNKVKEFYVEIAFAFFIHDFHDIFIKKSEISKEIYKVLLKNKIEIPYPARKVYVADKKLN